jgi:hypothetical protein
LHGYCLECPPRVWNDIGWKTTPATIYCLHPTGFICKNLGHVNSYIGFGTFLLGYELKKDLFAMDNHHGGRQNKDILQQKAIIEYANLFNKVLSTMGKSLVD